MDAFANIVIEWILHDYILFSDVPRILNIMCADFVADVYLVLCQRTFFALATLFFM